MMPLATCTMHAGRGCCGALPQPEAAAAGDQLAAGVWAGCAAPGERLHETSAPAAAHAVLCQLDILTAWRRCCCPCFELLLQLITGSVLQLEALLPQVAYGNIMAESPAGLTPAHFRQLLLLGQACLDYLHAICQATSRALVIGASMGLRWCGTHARSAGACALSPTVKPPVLLLPPCVCVCRRRRRCSSLPAPAGRFPSSQAAVRSCVLPWQAH